MATQKTRAVSGRGRARPLRPARALDLFHARLAVHKLLSPRLMATYRRFRLLVCLTTPAIVAAAVILPSIREAAAIPKVERERTPTCPAPAFHHLLATFSLDLPAVVGAHVRVNGDRTLIGLGVDCATRYVPIPASSFSWEIARRPPGSVATLGDVATLHPSLTLDRAGEYDVRLHVCPNGCTVQTDDGRTVVQVPRNTRSFVFRATPNAPIPVETQPWGPPPMPNTELAESAPTAFVESQLVDKCLGTWGAGAVSPQFVVVNPFNGPMSYALLEGRVVDKSRISRMDSPTNHNSQDHNFMVSPDPWHRHLVSTLSEGHSNAIGVEWERYSFPEAFRPTLGDRVSVYGFWIHDCGHAPYYTEIHPPVGIATHRTRAIQIPSDRSFDFAGSQATVGSNVWVPGIVTDIWFNRDGGAMVYDPSTLSLDVGLHQAPRKAPPGSANPLMAGDGIGAAPTNRFFEFDIHLPRAPHRQMVETYGKTVPPVPLFFEVRKHPSEAGARAASGPDPRVEVRTQGNRTYLHVTVDLRAHAEPTYARQIRAAWVYPDAANWGLKAYRVSVDSLEVVNDGDPDVPASIAPPFGAKIPGDWRFWINVNGGDADWVRLFDGDNNVWGMTSYQPGRGTGPWLPPFRNSATFPGDVLLFPGEYLQVHTSGFEKDWLVDDDTGAVTDFISQLDLAQTKQVVRESECNVSSNDIADSGCASYKLHYRVDPGDARYGASRLTPQAQALLAHYWAPTPSAPVASNPFGRDRLRHAGPDPELRALAAESVRRPNPLEILPHHAPPPAHVRARAAVERGDFPLISSARLQSVLAANVRAGAPQANAFMAKLRAHTLKLMREQGEAKIRAELPALKGSVPPELWRKHFADLEARRGR